jgi:RimJ/RimL family protein N-acetyltransferase
VTWQYPATADEPLLTHRLGLVPVIADDAEELTEVFGDERLYGFLGSHPTTTEQLRDQFARLAAARLADQEGTAQRIWTVRRRRDGRAVVGLAGAARGGHHHRPHPPRPPCLRQGGDSGGPGANRRVPLA